MGVKILFFSRGTLGQNSMFPEKGGQISIFFPNALKKGGQNRGAYQPTSLKGCPPREPAKLRRDLTGNRNDFTHARPAVSGRVSPKLDELLGDKFANRISNN